MEFSGSCLCGAVEYSGETDGGGGHCYCVDCRKSSGTGHGSHLIGAAAAFDYVGELNFYASPADSGNVVTRRFCPACGSPVFSTNSGFPGLVFVRASTLDDASVFTPQVIAYASRAPAWDAVPTDLPAFDEMPPLGNE
jgi:hypothetical protein